MPTKALGEALRDARENCGKSQTEAAEIAGVERHAITHWEQGKYEPRCSQVVRLAVLYGVDPLDIFRATITDCAT